MKTHHDVLLLAGPYLDNCYSVIAEYADRMDWHIEIAERYNPPRRWTGDGVLSMFLDEPAMNAFLESLVRRQIPVVDVFGIKRRKGLGAVISDSDELGRLAANHFMERGFVHAAFFAFEWTRLHDERYDAFASAWRGERPQYWIWPKEAGRNAGRKALADWTRKKLFSAPKPLAIYTYNSYNAAYIARICLDNNISVPHSVAILSANDNRIHTCKKSMSISGIDRDEKFKYLKAAELLQRMMDGKADLGTVVKTKPKGVITRHSTDVVAIPDETLRTAATNISRNISTRFGPSQIAAEIGIPLRRLNAMSKRELGHSVLEEISYLRIEEAKRLILTREEKLSAIAASTGFCNASYFGKVFRRITGQTPREWRKAHY